MVFSFWEIDHFGQVSSLDQYRREKEKLIQSGKVLQQQLTKSRQLLRDTEAMRAEKAKEMEENENELKQSEVCTFRDN